MSSTPRAYTQFPSQADLFYFCTTSSTSEEDLNIHYAPPSRSSLKIGVVVLSQDQLQLLDLAAIDLLAMVGRNRISKLNAPENVQEAAVDEVDIRYVNESGEGSFAVTSGARMPVTKRALGHAGFAWIALSFGHLRDSGKEIKNSFENAPQFDVLIIPGSFSSTELSVAASTFLTTQASNPNFIAMMSIASGILTLVQSGFLHQKRATGPSLLLPTLRQRFPETTWQDTPWHRQDSLWTSRSAVSAIDMIAAWMREYFWDRSEVVECGLSAAGITPLDEYE